MFLAVNSNQCVYHKINVKQPECSVFSLLEHYLINVGTLSFHEERFMEGKTDDRHNARIYCTLQIAINWQLVLLILKSM